MASTPGLFERPGAAGPADAAATVAASDGRGAATSEARSRSEVKKAQVQTNDKEEVGCSGGAESVRLWVGLLIKAGL